MTHTNIDVIRTFSAPNTKTAWAYLSGGLNWVKVAQTSADGVTNVFMVLNAARANNKKVTVNIVSNAIAWVSF